MEWTGPTSVSSNIFNQVDDLLNVYARFADRYEQIRQQCFNADDYGLRRDMETLSQSLRMMSEFFKDASEKVDQVTLG